ncbi:LysM peptidoglycan-binding domain-containing protein [Geomonas sp. RF6]|uniref:LysM peptidoglycan-binding domain-containing protein n=1 Tax=Geomonas sp. RF6 TaxID=2897342 RepID=UPI001E603C6C|nr:LysM peptidoglycan-binding domain-containing protein [Geomonas sp. RF6]UFS72285.1 LysM peptidoglycan-binding domain-containing protein [Geomonas sp. RF6]
MADILVITDQQRVSELFTRASSALENRLRIVPTLAQGEEEIAAAPPSHAFVQGTISGVSGDEVLAYLNRLLPPTTKVVLLAADRDSADRIRCETLVTAQDDAALERAITACITLGAIESAREKGDAAAPAPAEAARDLLFSAHHDEGDGSGRSSRGVWYVAALIAAIGTGAIAAHLVKHPAPPATVAQVTPQRIAPAAPQAATPAPAPQPGSAQEKLREVPAAAPADRRISHLVREGDTIWKILASHGIGESAGAPLLPEIKRLNHLRELERLKPGQTLVIPLDKR